MQDNETTNVASTILSELSIGAGLFLGGLFLIIGTWGVLSPIGAFMMVLGIAVPVWLVTMDPKGKIWRKGATVKRDRRNEGRAVMSNA